MVLLLVIYLAFISLGLPDSLIGAVWPVMHLDLQTKLEYAGFISASVSCGTIISTFFVGKIQAKLKASTITTISITLTAIGLLIYSRATSIVVLMCGAIPLGLGGGAVDATLNAYVASHYKAKHLSFLHAFWGIGTLIGPILFGLLLNHNINWRSGYLILAIVQIVIMITVFTSRSLFSDAKRDMSIKVESPKFLEVMKQPGVKQAVFAFLLYVGFETTTIMWSGSYLVYAKAFTPDKAAFISSLFFIGITSSRIFTGFISSKAEDRTLIKGGIFLILISCVLIMVLPKNFAPICLFLIGFGCGPIYPLMMHESATLFPKKYVTSIIGYQSAFSYIGIITLPTLYGFIAKNMGQWLLPIYIFIFVLVELINYCFKLKVSQKVINSNL